MFVIHRLMAAGAAAVLLGCGAEVSTEPSWQVITGLHHSPISRPAGGRCQTTFEFLPPAAGQPLNVQVVSITLNCNLRHLGLTSGVAIQTITSDGLTMSLINSSTYTAANGDELYAEFIGEGTLDPVALSVTFEGTETYLGGTGRFEGATGSSALAGSASLISSSGFYQTTGSITY
jgi:hypothetical protein